MFVATRLLCCRQVGAIMESVWKCGAGEKAEALGHLKCRSEYHSKLHKTFDNYNVLGDRDDACTIL